MRIVEIIKGYTPEEVRYVKPCEIPGLALWLDFADTKTLYDKNGNFCTQDGDAIDLCKDKSGNNLDAQAVIIPDPPGLEEDFFRPKLRTLARNSLSAAIFNKPDIQGFIARHSLQGDYPFEDYPATSFVVWKGYLFSAARSTILSFCSNNDIDICHNFAYGVSSLVIMAEGTSAGLQERELTNYIIAPFGVITDQEFEGYNYSTINWFNRFTNDVLINGETPDTQNRFEAYAPNVVKGKYSIGADFTTNYSYGIICEVIIYKRILNEFEINYIHKYLSFKWSISAGFFS